MEEASRKGYRDIDHRGRRSPLKFPRPFRGLKGNALTSPPNFPSPSSPASILSSFAWELGNRTCFLNSSPPVTSYFISECSGWWQSLSLAWSCCLCLQWLLSHQVGFLWLLGRTTGTRSVLFGSNDLIPSNNITKTWKCHALPRS